jgi:hypothetical protein
MDKYQSLAKRTGGESFTVEASTPSSKSGGKNTQA